MDQACNEENDLQIILGDASTENRGKSKEREDDDPGELALQNRLLSTVGLGVIQHVGDFGSRTRLTNLMIINLI